MIKEREYCSKIIETKINKPLVLTKKIKKILKILVNVGFVNKVMKNFK